MGFVGIVVAVGVFLFGTWFIAKVMDAPWLIWTAGVSILLFFMAYLMDSCGML